MHLLVEILEGIGYTMLALCGVGLLAFVAFLIWIEWQAHLGKNPFM